MVITCGEEDGIKVLWVPKVRLVFRISTTRNFDFEELIPSVYETQKSYIRSAQGPLMRFCTVGDGK